jgi:ankyrin repeat protein
MKLFLTIVSMFIFTSCEMHTQNGFLSGQSQGQVVSLKGSDVLFASLGSNDYFKLKSDLETDEYDINSPNERGNLLINEAIKLDRDLIVMLLIENGADPNELDAKDESAMDLISVNEHQGDWQKIINGEIPSQIFLDLRINNLVQNTAIDTQNDTVKKMELYLNLGANVNSTNQRGFTLLMNASLKGLPEAVTFLCEHPEIDYDVKFRRMNVIGLVKRQMRRNPSLKEILSILNGYIN